MLRSLCVSAAAACLILAAGSAGAAPAPKVESARSDPKVEALRIASQRALERQNLTEARALAEQAAATGDPEAINDLGNLVELGVGGPRDPVKAMALFEQAYGKGSRGAALNIGLRLAEGPAGGDRKRGCELLETIHTTATEGIRATSAGGLAVCYLFGYGGTKDIERGVDLLDEAAGIGTTDAMQLYLLGRTYGSGWGGRDENPAKSFGYFIAAARAGHPRAHHYAGMALLEGHGAAMDKAAAFDWFSKGAEIGDAWSQIDVAVMLATGEGPVKADAVKARAWYRKAVEQNSAHALRGLGDMLLGGLGGPVDRVNGVADLELATQGGDGAAEAVLKAYDPKLTPAERAQADRVEAEWLARHGRPWSD
jgi:TPR repeat protein